MIKEPWKDYPKIWNTEAKWWAWLRGGLRRSVWEKNPIKLEFIKQNRERIEGKREGTTRWGGRCNLCKKLYPQKQLQVDHVEGDVSLRSWNDVLTFILHLSTPEKLQLVCKPCHSAKSLADKEKISFDDAIIEKEIIRICKLPKQELIDFITENKYNGDISNAVKRRKAVAEILKQKQESSIEVVL